ncbi:MAG: CoA-binding protein [Candidatus Fischerbacteria bacterium RBG_13_37_8]|uniref:CoA-binding protein n=1 Tax=Candidatus Fischerbacteria bacterium RBG_13_37_8 TaxID=1817863 RepID=A0A1F5V5Q4_9BACT|nr:MAG: CoA-binding protein [Candidatus Fischerbacteria bacterium RBG_13_37_8]
MLYKLFHPKSVAIIGASQKALSIGNVITKNLLKYQFKGPIYPINPKADEILGVKAFPSLMEVPGDIDLVHISIPAKFTPDAIDECGQKGVKFVIINSAGFKEIGKEGEAIEQEVVARAKKHGIRVFGPNCQGIINSDPEYKAYCDFTFTYPEPGHVSIVAQSGGVGAIYMQCIHDLGIGMRFYASNGNACDISIPEILRYYGEDEKTRVIILYAEGFANPGEFMDAAKEVAAKKPILGMRAGRTEEGAKAAVSHTGGLAGVGLSTELIFKKTGILTFRDVEEMCQAAMAFATQPVPKGNRVGLITDTGGPAIIATDELVDNGLKIAPLSDKGKGILREKLYPEAAINNPVDVLATAMAPHYRAALDVLMDEENIDSVYITFVTPPFVDTESVAKEMAEVSKQKRKPIVCNYITDKPQWTGTTAILKEGGIPCYDFPEKAAKVLAAMTDYNKIRSRKLGKPVKFKDVDASKTASILQKAKETGREILPAADVYDLLNAYGIPVAGWKIAHNADEAQKAAAEIGFPVVIKADSEKIVHKSDVGGVVLNLINGEAVKVTVETMQKKFGEQGLRFFIQKYLPAGTEVIVGAIEEKGLGHMIMFGLGGVLVELFKDVSFEITPITQFEAEEMLTSIKSSALLSGFRGKAGVNRAKLIEIIQRVSQFVMENPRIKEMDLNPIIAYEDKVYVVDARIKI